jgi:hypothetical protein
MSSSATGLVGGSGDSAWNRRTSLLQARYGSSPSMATHAKDYGQVSLSPEQQLRSSACRSRSGFCVAAVLIFGVLLLSQLSFSASPRLPVVVVEEAEGKRTTTTTSPAPKSHLPTSRPEGSTSIATQNEADVNLGLDATRSSSQGLRASSPAETHSQAPSKIAVADNELRSDPSGGEELDAVDSSDHAARPEAEGAEAAAKDTGMNQTESKLMEGDGMVLQVPNATFQPRPWWMGEKESVVSLTPPRPPIHDDCLPGTVERNWTTQQPLDPGEQGSCSPQPSPSLTAPPAIGKWKIALLMAGVVPKPTRPKMYNWGNLPDGRPVPRPTRTHEEHLQNTVFLQSFINKALYARRHGYDFIWETSTVIRNTSYSLHWMKIVAVLKWLPLYDWIFMLDVDTIIMDLWKPAEHFLSCEAHIIACRDPYTVNTGAILFHRHPKTQEFLSEMFRTPPESWHPPLYDQGAFNYLIVNDSRSEYFHSILKIVPQRTFNSYPTLWCLHGERLRLRVDFLAHFAASSMCNTHPLLANVWEWTFKWSLVQNRVNPRETKFFGEWYNRFGGRKGTIIRDSYIRKLFPQLHRPSTPPSFTSAASSVSNSTWINGTLQSQSP